MTWEYKLIDHTADVAAEIYGDTLQELLYAGYAAWRELVAEKYAEGVEEQKQFEFSENSFEELLVGILSELNYILLIDKWITSKISVVSFAIKKDKYTAAINLEGRKHDSLEDILKTEIKAVTFHQMKIKKINGKYSTLVVFDI